MTKYRLFQTSQKLLFEMLVVFLGVLAAFWVEDYRESIDTQARAERILTAFQFDMQSQINWYLPWYREHEATRQSWASRRAQGEQIPPPYIPLPGAAGHNTTTWDAALATDALRVIDPFLLRQVGNFYYESHGISALWLRYIEHSQRVVLPVQGAKPEQFIDPVTGRYTPEIQINTLILSELWFELFDKEFAWPSWMIGEIQDYIHESNGTNADSFFCAVVENSVGGKFRMADGLKYSEISQVIKWLVETNPNEYLNGSTEGICWATDNSNRASCRLAVYHENLALMSERLDYPFRTEESLRKERDESGCSTIFAAAPNVVE